MTAVTTNSAVTVMTLHITLKEVTTDNADTALSVAITVTLMCRLIVISLLSLPLLPQCRLRYKYFQIWPKYPENSEPLKTEVLQPGHLQL